MLVDATVHQKDQATYLSEDVCIDYDGYKKETGDMYNGPHIYLSPNLPYCMILICDIQIVGSLVLHQNIHSHKKYRELLGQWRGRHLSVGGGNVAQSC